MKNTFRTYLLLMLVTFLISMNGYAQKVDVTNGTEYQDPSKTAISQLIGQDESGATFVLRTGKHEYFLEKFDNNLNQVFSHLIVLPKANEKVDYDVQDVLLIEGKFYIFASNYDKKAHLHSFYGGFLDASGKVSNFHQIAKIQTESKRNIGSFVVSISNDRTKICVHKNEIYEKKEDERFSIEVFDLALKSIWQKDVVLPIKDGNYEVIKTVVDKEANIHLFAQITIPRKEREKGEPSFYYQVFSYFHEDGIVKMYDIELGQNVISGIDIRLDDKNNLVGAGFYSEKNAISMKGSFYFVINPQTRKLQSIAKKEFTQDFLAKFMSAKKAAKGKELRDYLIRNIITKEDGGAVIVAEYYKYVETTTRNSNGTTTTTYTWYFNDLIVTNINPNGTIDWNVKVAKRQIYSTRSGTTIGIGGIGLSFNAFSNFNAGLKYLGIYSFTMGDKIHIIYNENPKNVAVDANPDKVKYMNNARKSITTLVTISANGKVEKTPLFPAKDAKSIVIPTFSKKLDENTLLMYGDKGKTYRFLKLHFGNKHKDL